MIRVINIDTKARTIRVSNEYKDIDWITVKGTHVPIKKGESKGEAVEKFVESKRGGQSDWEKQFGPLDKPLSKSAIKRMQKEDFDKNVRDAARRNAEEKARKSREKALKDQEEADFQKWKKEQKAHRIATNLFSAINTSQFTDAQLKSLISSFIYDEADNLDDDGVVTKDELNSEEFKRLKKFVAEKLAD